MNMDNFANQIYKILEPYRQIQKMVEPFQKLEAQMRPFNEVQKTFENIQKIYAPLKLIENPFQKQIEAFQQIGERLRLYAENTPKYLLTIARHGWFLDMDSELSFPSQVITEIEEGNIDEADRLLVEYYSESLDNIFSTLENRHPKRSLILKELKMLIDSNQYYAFIPQVFSQVDGVCFDFTKKKFFIKNRKTYLPEVTQELEKSTGSFAELYLSPIKNQTPIMAREEDLKTFPCRLNRHEIMHGINTTYGSRLNCLKVLSLFKYVSDLLMLIDEHDGSKPRKH
jgi:hypothetical protein